MSAGRIGADHWHHLLDPARPVPRIGSGKLANPRGEPSPIVKKAIGPRPMRHQGRHFGVLIHRISADELDRGASLLVPCIFGHSVDLWSPEQPQAAAMTISRRPVQRWWGASPNLPIPRNPTMKWVSEHLGAYLFEERICLRFHPSAIHRMSGGCVDRLRISGHPGAPGVVG
jgi:hypothetical protein